MSKYTALIAGATGLVGKELFNLLLSNDFYNKVTILSRSELQISDSRLNIVIIDDFDQLEEYGHVFNVTHVYCCLGTTMKKAGSSEMFRKIDLDYPLKMAALAINQPEFKSFHIVTSIGSSRVAQLFYNTVKGHLEQALKSLNLPGLKIYQPSLLLGKRKEFRFSEEIAKVMCFILSFFVIGSRQTRLWSIHSHDVAKAMFNVAKLDDPGTETFSPKDMIFLARQ